MALANAISESFVASLECELLHGHHFPGREIARTAIFGYEQAAMEEVAMA